MIPEEQRVVIVLFHMWQSLQVNQDLSNSPQLCINYSKVPL